MQADRTVYILTGGETTAPIARWNGNAERQLLASPRNQKPAVFGILVTGLSRLLQVILINSLSRTLHRVCFPQFPRIHERCALGIMAVSLLLSFLLERRFDLEHVREELGG